MSQFDSHFQDQPEHFQEPQATSGLAIASLVCSLIICCPLVTILGPILGVAAISSIGSPPKRRGKGLAMAGIIIGIITTIVSSLAYWQGGRWVAGYFEFVMEGPNEALQTGFANDINGFRGYFIGDGATATDDQVQAFLDELEQRYGTYISTRFDDQSGQPPTGQQTMVMPYRMQFSQATVNAQVELHFVDPQTGAQTKSLGYILIEDPDLGDLRYPPLQ